MIHLKRRRKAPLLSALRRIFKVCCIAAAAETVATVVEMPVETIGEMTPAIAFAREHGLVAVEP